MTHSAEYVAYLASPQWKAKRAQRLQYAGYRCEHRTRGRRCKERAVQCHHKTYLRLGHERLSDLVCLCKRHHAQADAQRRRKAQNARLRVWRKMWNALRKRKETRR